MNRLGCVSKDQIRAVAQEAGFEISDDQFQRWHLEGLLCPVQVGLAGGGSEVSYPKDSEKQVLAILNLLAAGWGLEDCLLWIWFGSYTVNEDRLRELLIRTLTDWKSRLKPLFSSDLKALSPTGDALVNVAGHQRLRPSPQGSIRRSLGAELFKKFCSAVLWLQVGHANPDKYLRREDQDLLWDGLRLDLIPFRHRLFRFLRGLDLPAAMAAFVQQMDLERVARTASLEDLRTVRDLLLETFFKVMLRPTEPQDEEASGVTGQPTMPLQRLTAVWLLLGLTHVWIQKTSGMTPEEKARFGALP